MTHINKNLSVSYVPLTHFTNTDLSVCLTSGHIKAQNKNMFQWEV